jgi:Bacterial Ig-like domain (group 3)/Putative Ig domain
VPGFLAATTMTETGTLPAGLTFTDLGGGSATLAGTPAAGSGGSYPLTLTASNSVGHTDQSFILTVHEAPVITSPDHTKFTVGSAGSFTVTTGVGSPVPPSLSVTGLLPGGVTFTDNLDGTATLAGTPAAATGGVYSFAIKASNGVTADGTQTFTLTVDEAPSVVSDDDTTFGSGVTGTFTVATAGFPTPVISETGTLPDGVTFVDNHDGTATMQGTPAAGTAGTYPITIAAANGVGSDATQSFTLTVTTAPQTIAFTSTPPAAGVVGQTYVVAAIGGASGNPVVFSIDASSSGVCSINGSTVHLNHPGSCLIDADQAGNAQYSAASASQTASVTKAATSTAVAVHARTVTATVTAVAPGAGAPTGSVAFAVKGKPVGTAVLSGGVATLTYHVPPGKTRQVSAVYSGDSDFTASSGSTSRRDPSITATVSSSHAKTKYGWYRSRVKITFHCTTHGAALTSACPSPVTLSHNGAGQSVARTVTAVDGGAATATIRGINIDMALPAVRITGVRSGASYPGGAPAAHCVGSDSLSGIASCTVAKSTRGNSVTVTARAIDRAGNIRSATVTYNLLRFYLLGASYQNGAFVVHEGHRYTLVALTTSRSRPRYYDAAPFGQTPHPADNLMKAAGSQFGLHRYTVSVYFGRGMGRYKYWNFGVKVGATMHLVKFHPVR